MDRSAIPARRYTTIRVIAYSGILLNFTWLLQFVDLAVRYQQNWQAIVQIMPWRGWALQAVSLVYAITRLAGSIAIARGAAWGRTLIVWASVVWSVALVMLSYWLPALVALPLNVVCIALLYSRSNRGFFAPPRSVRNYSHRERAGFVVLAASCTLHYWSILVAASPVSWIRYLIQHGRPMDLLEAAVFLLVLGTALASKHTRAWQAGMALITFAATMGIQLFSSIPTGTRLNQYMPDPKAYFPFEWKIFVVYTLMVTVAALALILIGRTPRQPQRPPMQMPDYS